MPDAATPMTNSRRPVWLAVGLMIAAAGALAFRLPLLDLRPMHGDEANQAIKTGKLTDEGVYRYDPRDHHGPTLYYLAALSARLGGHADFAETTEFTYRIVPVVFGVALILLLWPLREALGAQAALIAGLLLAVSPAFVFYSRYFIQEMLLVFLTLGLIVSGWRYALRPSIGLAVGVGVCAGLMHATKETCVLAFASMAVAGVASMPGPRVTGVARIDKRHAAIALGAAVAVSVVLFSSFFTYARGPLDSVLTYGNYLERADGAGLHDKPWYYYLGLLAFTQRGPGPMWFSEGAVLLLALAGAMAIAFRKTAAGNSRFLRFLALYTLFLTLGYSIVPYKTPWSMLSFYCGIALLAGVGGAALLRVPGNRGVRFVVAGGIAAILGHLGYESWQTSYVYPADPANPYVYAHTSTAHMRLVERMEQMAAVAPEGRGLLVAVVQPDRDYWPLPWYMRKFNHAGYFDALPVGLEPAVIIAAPALGDDLVARFGETHTYEMQGLRPGVLRVVFIRKDLWEAFMAGRR